MTVLDFTRLATGAIFAHRLRSALTTLGIAVGIAAVVLLTSIGEGIHRYVLSEFTQFGTNLIIVTPGRTLTHGVPGLLKTIRPLTIEDAEALRRVSHILTTVPIVQGNAEAEVKNKRRRTLVAGAGADFPSTYSFKVSAGRFLPDDDPRAARAFAVLGAKLKRELFGSANPLGQRMRVGGDRYRVIGVMEPKGNVLGIDIDDAVYIPAAKALELFNRDSLMEIDLLYAAQAPVEEIVAGIRRTLMSRHGVEDFTITTQAQMLDVLGSILNVLTFAVGALGGISLLVGGVGILTIMIIAVNERIPEIGLLRALGAGRLQVLALFIGEAAFLAAIGGLLGLILGVGGAYLLKALLPALPVSTPWLYVLLAECLAILIGLAAGVFPAHRAAKLDPVEALRAE
ncbi:MAG: ABC transporter permease [Acidiferrobacterales bacterium]